MSTEGDQGIDSGSPPGRQQTGQQCDCAKGLALVFVKDATPNRARLEESQERGTREHRSHPLRSAVGSNRDAPGVVKRLLHEHIGLRSPLPGVQTSMGRIWLVPVLLATWVCGAETVHACSCTPRSTTCGPPGEFWRASDVFTGRVVTIERPTRSTERRVQVQVVERWRGHVPPAGASVAVFTRSSSLCGYPFREGRDYVIYASRTEDGRLATSSCSRTAPLERAADDVSYARDALRGSVPAGRIVGDIHLKSRGRLSQGVPDVPVVLSHGGMLISTLTDRHGRYTIELPAAGRYDLAVTLPETHYAIQPRHIVEASDPHACIERDVEVFFNGRIHGRVIEPTGRGVAGLPVAHIPLQDAPRLGERTSVLTRDDGSYEIARLAPGPFEIRIELPVDPADRNTDRPVDGRLSVAARGALGEGERLGVGPFTLPPTMKVARLEGTVVGADGWSLADARVFLKGESGERLLGVPAISDALGRFVLAVAEGERYQVFAERPAAESAFSDPISIIVQRRMAPLRLMVRRRF